MRLAERYRPRCLADIVGQDHVLRHLRAYAAAPYATCWGLMGPPGTGKSAAALALAAELGAEDELSGLRVICTANLGKDDAQEVVRRLHMRPMAGRWNVVILEELERLSPQASVFLKVALASENIPASAVVIATSNDTSAVDEALLERFGVWLRFEARAPFAQAARERLAEIWAGEAPAGATLPANWVNWGWSNGAMGGRFSFRQALDACQYALAEAQMAHETGSVPVGQ